MERINQSESHEHDDMVTSSSEEAHAPQNFRSETDALHRDTRIEKA
jgi:hypothetical protein